MQTNKPDGCRRPPKRTTRAIFALAAIVAFASVWISGCARAPSPPPEPPRVLDYRNGWFHFASGSETAREIADSYRRSAGLVASLNHLSPDETPPAGAALYIPPVNDGEVLRETLNRINRDPQSIPRVPPKPELLAPKSGAGSEFADSRVYRPSLSAMEILTNVESSGAERPFDESVRAAAGRLAPFDRPLSDGSHPFAWPVRGRVVKRFDTTGDAFLPGVEIETFENSPVGAARDGVAIYAAPFEGYGLMVILDHFDGWLSVYGHNSAVHVRPNQRVKAGERIATVGRPTATSSSRLFFQIRKNAAPVDPVPLLP